VAKHAGANALRLSLARRDGSVMLSVADDGRGISEGALDQQLAKGHIGIVSQRVRVGAAGGRSRLLSAAPGTIAEIELPAVDQLPS